jgi:AcrR family transcriptional regulator
MLSKTSAPAEPNAGEPDKPLRADARRNRARLLDVAEAVFAARGTAVSTEEIAREAGVGIGTLFRHFPTKEALLTAVFVGRLHRLSVEAIAHANADDPGAAFFAFFTRVVRHAATKHDFAVGLADAGSEVDALIASVRQEVHRAFDTLLARAQQAGVVRDDIRPPDLLALMVGTARAIEFASADPDAQARTLAIVMDGLRPNRST